MVVVLSHVCAGLSVEVSASIYPKAVQLAHDSIAGISEGNSLRSQMYWAPPVSAFCFAYICAKGSSEGLLGGQVRCASEVLDGSREAGVCVRHLYTLQSRARCTVTLTHTRAHSSRFARRATARRSRKLRAVSAPRINRIARVPAAGAA